MWTEKRREKTVFIERYEDPMTGKLKKVSVTLEKDTNQSRKIAREILAEKIKEKLRFTGTEDITLQELVKRYQADQSRTVAKSTYRRNVFATNALVKILGGDVIANRLTAGYVRDCFNRTGESNGTLNERLKRFKALSPHYIKSLKVPKTRWFQGFFVAKYWKSGQIVGKLFEKNTVFA